MAVVVPAEGTGWKHLWKKSEQRHSRMQMSRWRRLDEQEAQATYKGWHGYFTTDIMKGVIDIVHRNKTNQGSQRRAKDLTAGGLSDLPEKWIPDLPTQRRQDRGGTTVENIGPVTNDVT